MDTRESDAVSLENFPPDIWAYFVYYLPVESLIHLMMTGATFVSQRLKFPKVVTTIKLGSDFGTFKSVPRLMNDFSSLENLSIYSCNKEWSTLLCLNLDSIPSGVRFLKLGGSWSDCITQLVGPGGSLKLLKHLPHLETLDLCGLNIPGYSWRTVSLQSLTSLSLYRWNGAEELPSSLIHFCAGDVALSTHSIVSSLPPALESFVVTRTLNLVNLLVPLLPPSTLKFSLGGKISSGIYCPYSPNNLHPLPKSLTWFAIKDADFPADPEFTSFLPSTLTELTVDPGIPCVAWPLLPQQLTKLVFTAPGSQFTEVSKFVDNHGTLVEVSSIPFQTLPRSITSLELHSTDDQTRFCGPPRARVQSYFPPRLSFLRMSNIQLSSETAKLLPSSLKHLEIANLSEHVCEHLPKGLTTLTSFGTLMSPNLISFLPKSLTTLETYVPLSSNHWFDNDTGEVIGSISTFQMYKLAQGFDWEGNSLPTSLRHFSIGEAEGLQDSFFSFQHLPNLVELHLRAEHLSDISIPLLSAHLTSLSLSRCSMISGQSFRFLPRGLTHLDLCSSESIFDSDIQHLPRTLKQVYLYSTPHLTDLCIPDLPPQLELFDARNSPIQVEFFANEFPSPLQQIQKRQQKVAFS